MTCPQCHAPMLSQTLEGHGGASVTIDVCLPCEAFWFDHLESLQLSPAATLQLFRLVGDHSHPRSAPASVPPACPRCAATLLVAHDLQRSTRFEYLRCPRGHGRFISFFNFLREKDFIRPLPAADVEALKRNVQVVNCSNCGAPIDLAKGSTCTHCGTALSMIDMKQAEALVHQLQHAEQPDRRVDPLLALRLQQARREVEQAFASFDRQPSWSDDVAYGGVVGAGVKAIAKWLKG